MKEREKGSETIGSVAKNPDKYIWLSFMANAGLMSSVLTLFYQSRGVSLGEIFLLYAIIVIAMFFAEIPTGIIADRYGRKTSIVIGLIGMLLIQVGFLFAHSFLFFAVLFFIMGVAITFFSGADEALIYDSLKESRKENEMKKYSSRILAAKFLPLVILAPIGSFIAKDLLPWQFTVIMVGDILFSCIALAIGLTLVEPRITHKNKQQKPWKLFRTAVKHIRSSDGLWRLFLNKTLILIPASHIYNVLWQPYLQSTGISVLWFGTISAIGAVALFIMLRYTEIIERKLSAQTTLFLSSLLPAIAFFIAALWKAPLMGLVFYFVIKLTVWMRDPLFSQYMNDHIDSHNRATVLSTLSMVDSLFDIGIFLAAGLLSDISITYTFIASSVLMFIAIVFFPVRASDFKKTTK